MSASKAKRRARDGTKQLMKQLQTKTGFIKDIYARKIAKVRASKEKRVSTPDDASVMQKKAELVQVQNDLDDLIEAAAEVLKR